jgi:hypothetical protein
MGTFGLKNANPSVDPPVRTPANDHVAESDANNRLEAEACPLIPVAVKLPMLWAKFSNTTETEVNEAAPVS